MALTPNFSFDLPTVGASKDTWGTSLNANWTSLDTLLATYLTTAVAASTYVPLAGGTITGKLTLSASFPAFAVVETKATVDNKNWRIGADAETFSIGTKNDSDAGGSTAIAIDRTGTTVDDVRCLLGTTLPDADSVVTRERGDARYAQLTGAVFSGSISGTGAMQFIPNSGTFATPGLTFGSSGVGMYIPSADLLRIKIAAANAVQFEAAGTAMATAITAVTREKGDARYRQLSTAVDDGILHVRDVKASGTDGGSSVASTWTARALNTTVLNTITGASLATDQITLPAGTYDIEATSPVGTLSSDYTALVRLQNITDGTTTLESPNLRQYAGRGTATVRGRFTIAAPKVFEVQYWVSTALATSGLGAAASIGGRSEIYAEALIRKVG